MATVVNYNIEKFVIKNEKITLYGWIVGEHQIDNIFAVFYWKKGIVNSYPATKISRKDVENLYGNDTFAVGFLLKSKLQLPSKPHRVCLRIEFSEGSINTLDITNFMSLSSKHFPHRQLIGRWLRLSLAYLRKGEFRLWWTLLRRKIRQLKRPNRKRASLYAFPTKVDLVIFDHNLGGGANWYRNQLVKEALSSTKQVLLITYDFWQSEFCVQHPPGTMELTIDDLSELQIFLSSRAFNKIVINNLVSYDEPLLLLSLIEELAHKKNTELIFPLHDYFCLCPSFYLLDHSGKYCGLPENEEICRNCLLHNPGRFRIFFPDGIPEIQAWRKSWRQFLREVNEIICFSQSSAKILLAVYPELLDKIKLIPHRLDDFPREVVQWSQSRELHIGVVGNIYEEKGAKLVKELAEIIHINNLPIKITIIGTIESPPPYSFVKVTGPYERQHLPFLVRRSGANVFFIPSIWPETYCLTVDELMSLNVPVAVLDIGAPPERVKSYPWGLVIKDWNPYEILRELHRFWTELCKTRREETT